MYNISTHNATEKINCPPIFNCEIILSNIFKFLPLKQLQSWRTDRSSRNLALLEALKRDKSIKTLTNVLKYNYKIPYVPRQIKSKIYEFDRNILFTGLKIVNRLPITHREFAQLRLAAQLPSFGASVFLALKLFTQTSNRIKKITNLKPLPPYIPQNIYDLKTEILMINNEPYFTKESSIIKHLNIWQDFKKIYAQKVAQLDKQNKLSPSLKSIIATDLISISQWKNNIEEYLSTYRLALSTNRDHFIKLLLTYLINIAKDKNNNEYIRDNALETLQIAANYFSESIITEAIKALINNLDRNSLPLSQLNHELRIINILSKHSYKYFDITLFSERKKILNANNPEEIGKFIKFIFKSFPEISANRLDLLIWQHCNTNSFGNENRANPAVAEALSTSIKDYLSADNRKQLIEFAIHFLLDQNPHKRATSFNILNNLKDYITPNEDKYISKLAKEKYEAENLSIANMILYAALASKYPQKTLLKYIPHKWPEEYNIIEAENIGFILTEIYKKDAPDLSQIEYHFHIINTLAFTNQIPQLFTTFLNMLQHINQITPEHVVFWDMHAKHRHLSTDDAILISENKNHIKSVFIPSIINNALSFLNKPTPYKEKKAGAKLFEAFATNMDNKQLLSFCTTFAQHFDTTTPPSIKSLAKKTCYKVFSSLLPTQEQELVKTLNNIIKADAKYHYLIKPYEMLIMILSRKENTAMDYPTQRQDELLASATSLNMYTLTLNEINSFREYFYEDAEGNLIYSEIKKEILDKVLANKSNTAQDNTETDIANKITKALFEADAFFLKKKEALLADNILVAKLILINRELLKQKPTTKTAIKLNEYIISTTEENLSLLVIRQNKTLFAEIIQINNIEKQLTTEECYYFARDCYIDSENTEEQRQYSQNPIDIAAKLIMRAYRCHNKEFKNQGQLKSTLTKILNKYLDNKDYETDIEKLVWQATGKLKGYVIDQAIHTKNIFTQTVPTVKINANDLNLESHSPPTPS